MYKSIEKRDRAIVRIYDEWAPKGVPNEVIYRRHIQMQFGVSRTTFYRILKRCV